MATIKVKFRPSTRVDGEGAVYYQITHERSVKRLVSAHRLANDEWDHRRSAVRSRPGNSSRMDYLIAVSRSILRDVERLSEIIARFDSAFVSYTAADVATAFNRYMADFGLVNFMEGMITRLAERGRQRTSETYRATLRSFMKFRGGADLPLDTLSAEIMEDYQAWLTGRGVSLNTVSFYMRVMRAVYNRAADTAAFKRGHPFRHVYTGVDKTTKRALPMRQIRCLKRLDLSAEPSLDYARDMFMLSFYLRGMSFIDMAFLRKSNLRGGHLSYCRRKTGQQLSIKWTPEMQAILDKYPVNATDYLLPIIRNPVKNDRSVYLNMSYTINRDLKKVGRTAGIVLPLTLYVARHSWASVALAKGVPVSVISEGLGHDSESTTRIYLAALDNTSVDKANSLILKNL